MKFFTAYSLDTGEVQYVGQCEDADFVLQQRAGMGLVEGVYPAEKYYWDGTKMAAIPPQPPFGVWNYALKRWDTDLVTADKARRQRRDALLRTCDWTQLSDAPPATQQLWRPYRQALRDITSQPGYPLTVTWPTPPA